MKSARDTLLEVFGFPAFRGGPLFWDESRSE